MYNFLWPIFGPDSIGNALKTVSLHSTAIVVRHYGGTLVSESLCLLIKITQSDEICLCTSSEFGGYSGIGKKFSWPTIAEKSKRTSKPATVFQNSTKNYKGYKIMYFLLYSYN